MEELNDIFDEGTDTPEAAVEAPPPVEAEAPTQEAEPEKVERPRGPDGKFIPKGETPEAQPAPEGASPAPAEPPLEHPALLGERRRRQEAEAQLQQMQAQLAQLQQAPPKPAPDQFEDPDGYTAWLREEIKREAVAEARAEAMQAVQYQRIEMSAMQARQSLPDYDEKIAAFGQMIQSNPALLEQLYRAPNPAEYAYNTAKTQLEISQYGGIDGLINARVAEALKTAQPATAPTPPIPDSLAATQSARNTAAPSGPPSLEEILGS